MRLVTRGDLDGLTCCVILSRHEEIEEIILIHPQDITEGRADIRPGDIVANLPYHPNADLWFDHHMHTATPEPPPPGFEGSFGPAPSAARLVYEYYGGEGAMPELAELVAETDRLDSADLGHDDIVNPHRYIKLGFTIDSRTGLGAFERYFEKLHLLLARGMPIEEILEQPEVKHRCDRLDQQNEAFGEALLENSEMMGNVVVTDFRDCQRVPIGNRFLIYAMFPEANVSVRVQWGPDREFPVALLGHSIVNRTCQTNVGDLAARYGGGGHFGAGSVPLLAEDPDSLVQMLVAELRTDR